MFDNDDEVLVLMLDYLLWIVCVSFVGGNVVYYICDEEVNWYFDIDDIKLKIIFKIKVIVFINLNNLIGVVYLCEIL